MGDGTSVEGQVSGTSDLTQGCPLSVLDFNHVLPLRP